MYAKGNVQGTITAFTNPNPTAAMALQYYDIISTPARTADKGVVNIEVNESFHRIMINAVHQVQYMRKDTEDMQKMRDELEAEN